MFRIRIMLSLAIVVGMLSNAVTADDATNTNQCVANLGGIMACQDRGPFGFPTDIRGCCDGVRQLAVDQCECNPTIDVLLGMEGTQIYDIEPLCRIVQPAKWWRVPVRPWRSCDNLDTHSYGCEQSDMEVDAARLANILAFSELFQNLDDESQCFDTPAFVEEMKTLFTPDIAVTVPYGIGTYTGYDDIAEYLGMIFAGLNHGFWMHDPTVDPTKPARLEVSADGSTWYQGSTSQGSFLRGKSPYTDAYTEQEVIFNNCETRISTYNVLPSEGLRDWIEKYVQTADLSDRWGVKDICRYHTKFCAGNPETEQYASEQACMDYLSELPVYTEACGINRPLNGHSISCKFKHHFMIPANPGLHCAHIGPLGSADINTKFKCDDVSECSVDEGQDAWPPISNIGSGTPQDIIDLFTESNIGYENEPFGCAVPTAPRAHHH